MRVLRCTNCGLSYGSATVPQHLLSSSGAACPRCSSPLTGAYEPADATRRPRFGFTPKRHQVAVQRSLSWADDAARDGDYANALSWLATIEAIDGALPESYEARRRAWAERIESGPEMADKH